MTEAVRAWLNQYGPICPGYQRDPHEVIPSDLTADHVTPAVRGGIGGQLRILCRSCNSKRGARG